MREQHCTPPEDDQDLSDEDLLPRAKKLKF